MNTRAFLAMMALPMLVLQACAGGAPPRPAEADLDQRPAAEALPLLAQRLLDALPHDAAVWSRYLSEQAVYVSEAGESAGKAELLEGFAPFPPGISGSIEVLEPRVTDAGDVATIVFRARERQAIFGQAIEVDYLTSQTWRREDGRWRLLLSHNGVRARDPEPQPVAARSLRGLVGTYALGPDRRFAVELRGDEIFGGPPGRAVRLIALGDNVFADAGNPLGVLRIFVRDAKGRATHMIQRRKHADVVWQRVP